MEDLEDYRKFIEHLAPYGYALLFRKCGDFNRAQVALENAFVDSHSSWILRRPETRNAADFIARLADKCAVDGAAESTEQPAGLLTQSQKLQALGSAMELLRSFPGDDQVALFLLHVEEVAPDRILDWLGKDPAYLAGVVARLKEQLARWSPTLATHEEPTAFFMRALRQNRLSSQFSSTVLLRLQRFNPGWSAFGRFAEWGLLVGIPFWLLSLMSDHYWNYPDYDPVTNRIIHSNILLQQLPIDLFMALAALLQNRYLVRHAPPPLAKGLAPWLMPLLGLAAMSGFGFLICEALVLFNPDSIRGLTRSPWVPLHTLWSLATIALVLTGAYQMAIYYLKMADAGDAAGRGEGS